MNELIPLHWSFDHTYHHAPKLSFREELLACLESVRSAPPDEIAGGVRTLRYTALPNYWSGYRGDGDVLAFGKVMVQRTLLQGGRFRYQVAYSNEASGEDLQLDYETDANPTRALQSPWSLETANRAGDLYKAIRTSGALVESGTEVRIELCVNDRLTLTSGHFPPGESVCCNWSLFDCMGEIVKNDITGINLLEDLEKLKPGCRIAALESTTIELAQKHLKLDGYAVYGSKEVPSYWWLDESGQVAVMSNVFNTFVLTAVTT